ncbi:S-layer homology domain-containing protein [Aneurinibacillus thermoaerophilus]|uniref:S-layer homology domain-containing protein n=1 Tax=Aneurinibacillus thermoaerophilus TaxID=143495 RepID=UPI002E22C767|nr:S-layer homology domain-containing protein [Aneurinibacillus thermoaerophilus]
MGFRNTWKKYFALFTIFFLFISTVLGFSWFQPKPAYASIVPKIRGDLGSDTTVTPDTVTVQEQSTGHSVGIEEAIQTASQYALSHNQLSEWEAIGLARAGQAVPASYLESIEREVAAAKGQYRKVTDYERIALAVKAVGGDPTAIAGYNFIEKIYNNSRMTNQGLNGPIFALIALDCGDYKTPEDAQWNREKLIAYIVQHQYADGSWPLSPGAESNLDITAMALTSLAPYKNRPEVQTVVDKAVAYLSAQQNETGGYTFRFLGDVTEPSETTAQVIIALTANGIDPTSAAFTKSGKNLLHHLLSYRQSDGGFVHVAGGKTDRMATEQALQALVAYDLFTKGKSPLYRFAAQPSPPTSEKPPTEPGSPLPDGSTPPEGGTPPNTPVPVKKTITLSVIGDSQRGVILPAQSVELKEGDTAYTVLRRMLGNKVESRGSGATLYVEAIDGLGEFDRGPQSGWMYSVNGWFPNYSAGIYMLEDGDVVAWRYTLDLGKDLGAYFLADTYKDGTFSIPAHVENELNRIGLTPNNTQPISKVATTTVVLNAAERMDARQAEQIKQSLANHTVSLQQSVSAAVESVIKDNMDEVQLIVPAQALSKTTSLTITEQMVQRPELVSGMYDFGPDGTKFNKSIYIMIKIPIETEQLHALVLAWLDEQKNEWIPIPAVLDAKTGIIIGKVDHFTKFAVIDRSKVEKTAQSIPSLDVEIESLCKRILANASDGNLTEWEAFALARAGRKLPPGYLASIEKMLREKNGQFRKVTDYERIALAVKAAGGNPASIGGYNLIEKIYNHEHMTIQGTNGPIFALLAFDSGKYEIPNHARWTRNTLIDWLVQQQNPNGGFPLVKGEESNVDITAMAITALSSYLEKKDVKQAVDKAVQWLSEVQLKNGGYKLFGDENSESVSQVIIALASVGIDPKDARFVKEEGDVVTSLFRFKQADGGYAHVIGQPANKMATEQALMALVAYDRFLTGKEKLYQITETQAQATFDTDTTPMRFVDEGAISDWAMAAVYQAYEKGLMESVSEVEQRFAPKQAMTRAQLTVLLMKLRNEMPAVEAKQVFMDVTPENWYYGYVMKAREKGIVQGVTPSSFQPEQIVSRQEMAVMIAKAFGLSPALKQASFRDNDRAFRKTLPYIQAVREQKIMVGADDAFYPDVPVTREMAAVVAIKLYEKMNK